MSQLIIVFALHKIQMQQKNKNNFQWNQLIWKTSQRQDFFFLSIEYPTEMGPLFFIYFSLHSFASCLSWAQFGFLSLFYGVAKRKTEWMSSQCDQTSTMYTVQGNLKATTGLLSPVKPHSIKPSIVLSSIKHLISLRFLNKILKIRNEWMNRCAQKIQFYMYCKWQCAIRRGINALTILMRLKLLLKLIRFDCNLYIKREKPLLCLCLFALYQRLCLFFVWNLND